MITSNETIYTGHGSASTYILYMMHVCAHYIHPEYHIQPTALRGRTGKPRPKYILNHHCANNCQSDAAIVLSTREKTAKKR